MKMQKISEAISIIPAAQRHYNDFGWLQTYWLFSFSDYYDPNNLQFGALRVFNDDVVAAGKGFPSHAHKEMEIITLVLEGELTHEDSAGHVEVIRPGEVQRMTAGRGIRHSEFNRSDQPVHLYQIWIRPDQNDLTPSYEQKAYDPALWRNQLHPVASGQGHPGAVVFRTDAAVYRADLDAQVELAYGPSLGRGAFVYLIEGQLQINQSTLQTHDQARIIMETPLTIKALEPTRFILIDVPL